MAEHPLKYSLISKVDSPAFSLSCGNLFPSFVLYFLMPYSFCSPHYCNSLTYKKDLDIGHKRQMFHNPQKSGEVPQFLYLLQLKVLLIMPQVSSHSKWNDFPRLQLALYYCFSLSFLTYFPKYLFRKYICRYQMGPLPEQCTTYTWTWPWEK